MRTRNDGLHIIWTIALKDIADAIQNKVVLSLVVGLGAMLLMPRMMSLIIDPPYTEIVVYDVQNSWGIREDKAVGDSASEGFGRLMGASMNGNPLSQFLNDQAMILGGRGAYMADCQTHSERQSVQEGVQYNTGRPTT